MTTRNKSLSGLALITCILVIAFIRISNPPRNVLSWDVMGYYMYLPAAFITGDIKLDNPQYFADIIKKYESSSTLYQVVGLPDGRNIFRYSMGMAYFYLPFFLAGHAYATLSGTYPADGFSQPYQTAAAYGALLYAFLGLILLRKILSRFLPDIQVAITLILLVFGTNLLHTFSLNGLMSHNFLFTQYALLIWFTILYYERPRTYLAILIGLIAGITILARPTEIICLAIPMLWGVTGRNSLQERIAFLKMNWRHVAWLVAALAAAGLPQLIYWKLMTGSFLFYSYSNPGEGFEFLWPYTLKTLFSFRKGWLLYTPMMIFSLLGLLVLFRSRNGLFPAIFVFFILNLYLISSWSCWWYASSFSNRAFIQSYAVMAIPLGFFINLTFERAKLLRWLLLSVMLLLLMLNLFQSWQFHHRIIDQSRMTKAYYFAVFGKTSVDEEDRKKLMVQRSLETVEHFTDTTGYQRKLLALESFEDGSGLYGEFADTTMVIDGKYSLRMEKGLQVWPSINKKFREITNADHAWLRATVYAYPLRDPVEEPFSFIVTFQHKGGNYQYRGINSEDASSGIKAGQWNRITMDYMTPEIRSINDNLSVYIWYRDANVLYIDSLTVEAWEPIESR